MKTRLDEAKGHSNQDKRDLYELEHHERELHTLIEALDSTRLTEEQAMSDLRQQLLQHKRDKDQVYRQERELEQKIRQREREREVEQVVVKKMAIEKMREQQSLIDELLRKKESEVDAINRTNQDRDYNSSLMLKKALERAEVL